MMKLNRWIVLLGATTSQILSWFDIRTAVATWFGQDPAITPTQAALGAASIALYIVFFAVKPEQGNVE